MFGFISKKSLVDDENMKNPPTDDAYAIIPALYDTKNHEIGVNALALTVIDLINKNQIKCEINLDESYSVGKDLSSEDMEVMKKITLRIVNKGELKSSETAAINLLKTMNKNKKFNLKDMAKRSNNSATANKFESDIIEYRKSLELENKYSSEEYKDILHKGKFTNKGKDLKKDWENFQTYLTSQEYSDKYPPESVEENSAQIIYAACFDNEKEALDIRKNNSALTDFIDKDGYKLLNIIFHNAMSNVTTKRKGDGIFYGINDKYTIPGA